MQGNHMLRAHHIPLFLVAVVTLSFFGLLLTQPQPAASQSSPVVIFLTSGTSWTVPSNWNSSNNTIEVIAGGGGGGAGFGGTSKGGGGGGGGAYSKVSNLTLTTGGTVTIQIGSGGAVGSAGGDTWLSTTGSAPTSPSQGVLAKGGSSGYPSGTELFGGAGGAAASGVGNVKYSGGKGGNVPNSSTGNPSGGGGGGAAGTNGNGGNGGNGVGTTGSHGGGGGGANGGSAGSGSTPGNNRLGTGAGTVYSGNGTNGGGGAGGRGRDNNAVGQNADNGGTGSQDTVWTQTSDGATVGPSSGGGGGGYAYSGAEGKGASASAGYGAGGGGGGVGTGGIYSAPGSPGIIVITYTPNSPPGTPGTPTFSSVTQTSMRVSWTAATDASSYKVERCQGTGCSSFSQIASGITTLYYDDSGLTVNTTYRYRVRGTNTSGDGPYSGTGTQATSADVPGAPTSLNAIASANDIALTWSAPVSDGGSPITNYKVYRDTASPAALLLATIGNTTNYTDSTALVNTTYYYRVKATNSAGDSAYSNEDSDMRPCTQTGTSDGNVSGWAWSDTIGWISFNASDDGTCTSQSYGLDIASDGAMSGYAWSENVGWISANSSDLSGCPQSPCTARMEGYAMKGWMKALAANQAEAGGWDGFISLSGTSPDYGPTLASGIFTGYAWGDTNLGWISFNSPYHEAVTPWVPCTPTYVCTDETHYDDECTIEIENIPCSAGLVCSTGQCVIPPEPFTPPGDELTVNPRLIRKGGTVSISWDVTYADSCTVTGGGITWTGTSSATADCTHDASGEACVSPPINAQTTFTLTCTGLGGDLTETATVYISPLWKEL